MKYKKTIIASIIVAGATIATFFSPNSDFPNKKLTPGLIRTNDIKDICEHKTSVYRKTTEAMKNEIFKKYKIKSHAPGQYEIDHWYSLGIGGADDIKNLWPMPAPQFHEKDKVEFILRNRLCAKKITQKQAVEIIDNWRKHYNEELSNNLGGLIQEDADDEIL